jgi:taspase, threonine aspartase, 1
VSLPLRFSSQLALLTWACEYGSVLQLLISSTDPMQDSNRVARHQHISEKLSATWKRLRTFRRGIHKESVKAEKYTIDILPSPFRPQNTVPFQSDPNGPALSSASLQAIEKLSRETTSRPARLFGPAMDGALEKRFGSSRSSPVAAIFVHAGAGYHSTTNEHIHLAACKE